MIRQITDTLIVASDGGWALDPDLADRVDGYWAQQVAANPHLFNGEIYGVVAPGWPGGVDIVDGVLRATAVRGAYATFLAWRDWGFPEIGLRNLFGSAVLVSSDNALIYGVMGRTTSNAGRVYPPGGSLDPNDLTADGRLDVFRSVDRELTEETGLTAAEAILDGTLVVFDGPRISVARMLRFPEPADELARRIRGFLGREFEPELDDVLIVRRSDDLPADRTPGYARMIADRHFDGADACLQPVVAEAQ